MEENKKKDFGAFMKRFEIVPEPSFELLPPRLIGYTFCASDNFQVEGHATGFGNPLWESTPATWTSMDVTDFVEIGGATLIGKTIISDMALSLTGENLHYGTPTNPAAPDRIPGGSSSGSAVAVAAKLANFALGIDTDGGVRIPAAYCGVYGFRPSYGMNYDGGFIPVSHQLDTVGIFAGDHRVLLDVVPVHLPITWERQTAKHFVVAEDVFRRSEFPTHGLNQVVKSIENVYGGLKRLNLAQYLNLSMPSLKSLTGVESIGDGPSPEIRFIAKAMQKLKRYDFMRTHTKFTDPNKAYLGLVGKIQAPEIEKSHTTWTRFKSAFSSMLFSPEIETPLAVMTELQIALCSLLENDGILVIPTCNSPPSKLGVEDFSSEEYLIKTSALSSLASMSGCCEVAIPLGMYEGCPISVSFLARNGADSVLMDAVARLGSTLPLNYPRAAVLADSANKKGDGACWSKHWEKAFAYYTEAIKLNGSNPKYYVNRAAAYLENQRYLNVETDCTEAIKLDEESEKAYILRGTAREQLGNYHGAREDFRRALSLNPTNDRASKALERIG